MKKSETLKEKLFTLIKKTSTFFRAAIAFQTLPFHRAVRVVVCQLSHRFDIPCGEERDARCSGVLNAGIDERLQQIGLARMVDESTDLKFRKYENVKVSENFLEKFVVDSAEERKGNDN